MIADGTFIIIIIIIKKMAMQGREREIDTLSVRRPQPHTNILWRKTRERENNWRQKKERETRPTKKALDLLLKPVNPTPSNTGSTRLFHIRYLVIPAKHSFRYQISLFRNNIYTIVNIITKRGPLTPCELRPYTWMEKNCGNFVRLAF